MFEVAVSSSGPYVAVSTTLIVSLISLAPSVYWGPVYVAVQVPPLQSSQVSVIESGVWGPQAPWVTLSVSPA